MEFFLLRFNLLNFKYANKNVYKQRLMNFRELADFIFPSQVKHVPDIFAIGTQESYSERTEWEITIQEVLGPSHLLLHSYYLGKKLT